MSLLDLFRRRSSAPVARERLQVLLAHERGANGGHSELLARLQEEILQVIAKHMQIDREKVQIKLDRNNEIAMLEIDVEMPNLQGAAATRH
jgi:cell division topological specificity factor